MNLRDLTDAVLEGDLLRARQWVADARREELDWVHVPRPEAMTEHTLAVAAGLAELLAARCGSAPPAWTSEVAAANVPIVLDPGLESMRRSFAYAKAFGPAPLRERNLIALPDFLDVA